MSAGFFFQSQPVIGGDTVPGIKREALILPGIPDRGETEPTVWKRRASGNRTKDYKWEKTSLSAFLATLADEEPLLRLVGVAITPANARDLSETGQSTTLVTKAVKSLADNTGDYYPSMHAAVADVFSRMAKGDQTLADMVEGKMHGEIAATLTVDPTGGKPRAVRATDEDIASLPSPPVDDDALMVAAFVEPTLTEASTPTTVVVQQVQPQAGRTTRFVPYNGASLMVPRKVYENYVGRYIVGHRDMDIMDMAFANGHNVLVEGPTGPGKSTFGQAWAARRNMPCAILEGDGPFNLHEWVGMRDIDPLGTSWIDGPVAHIARHGGLLVIEEINMILAKNLSSFHGMFGRERTLRLRDNNNETIKLHPNTMIYATMNPGYIGTQELSAAIQNRFQVRLVWEYDPDVEKELGIKQPLATLAASLRGEHAHEILTPVPTNALLEFQRIAETMGLEFAIYNFVNRFDPDERSKVGQVVKTMEGNLATVFNTRQAANALDDN